MDYDYYYGTEADQFQFFRIPRLLMLDSRYKNISLAAKMLYGLLLDRIGLSIKNGWHDQEGRVYIIYPLSSIQDDLNCSVGKAVRLMAELDNIKGIGLIERSRRGQGKADIIYVKRFTALPRQESPDNLKMIIQTSQNKKSGTPKTEIADYQKEIANYTKDNQPDNSNIQSVILSECAYEDVEMTDEDFREDVATELDYNNSIPQHERNDRRWLAMAIRVLCGWYEMPEDHYATALERETYRLAVATLLELVSSDTCKIEKMTVSRDQVIDKINQCISKEVCFLEYLDMAVSDYVAGARLHIIKVPQAYMRIVLWRAFSTYRIKLEAQLERA